jgi:hypothetical protein
MTLIIALFCVLLQVIPIVIESYPGLPIVIACVINIIILGGAMIIYVIKRR